MFIYLLCLSAALLCYTGFQNQSLISLIRSIFSPCSTCCFGLGFSTTKPTCRNTSKDLGHNSRTSFFWCRFWWLAPCQSWLRAFAAAHRHFGLRFAVVGRWSPPTPGLGPRVQLPATPGRGLLLAAVGCILRGFVVCRVRAPVLGCVVCCLWSPLCCRPWSSLCPPCCVSGCVCVCWCLTLSVVPPLPGGPGACGLCLTMSWCGHWVEFVCAGRAGVCVCVWLCVVCLGVWRAVIRIRYDGFRLCMPYLFWFVLSVDVVTIKV